ncbi:Nucleoside-diphosphate-sugar epimerase [Chitinophaga sp. CF118]|uniref:NAD-dependent epimerase/dehydratase family protein n=1 Tax=Chitinophaga sp. CF118 TaxID=1884367 RepID=UPI0008E511CF|nr:NAD-dependent epimerase/dehydratase family protein [Chitinophaga sp. CF118]SFE26506.1 Nucleoside-diphosphate-sugar epimerase [Chitinophaga sp. CF118]
MNKITFIGGSGFIGTELIEKFKTDYIISNLDKKESETFKELTVLADVRNKESLRKIPKDTDIVILLAAEHTDNVTPTSLYYDVNVEGTRNVLEIMDEMNINNIIFTSSVAIYGLDKDEPDEDSPADPFNHYGKSKWAAEEILREWHSRQPEKRTVMILRPTVVFGEKNRGNVYNLLKQIKTGRFLMIGDGKNKKSMSYVRNIVTFIKYWVDQGNKGYHVFNYADKPDLSTVELINVVYDKIGRHKSGIKIPYFIGYLGGIAFDILAKLSGRKFPVSSVRIKKFCSTTQFSASKIINIGFKAPYTLREGLERTIDTIS